MTISEFQDKKLGASVTLGLIVGVALYCVSFIVFKAYVHTFDPLITPRIEGFTHFGWIPLVLVVAQSFFSYLTKKPELVLVFFLFFNLLLSGAFAWSGPSDQLKIVQALYNFKMAIYAFLPILNAVICQLILIRQQRLLKS